MPHRPHIGPIAHRRRRFEQRQPRALLAVVTLLPDVVTGDARLTAVRAALATSSALLALLTDAALHLATPPRPSDSAPSLLDETRGRPRAHTGWGQTGAARFHLLIGDRSLHACLREEATREYDIPGTTRRHVARRDAARLALRLSPRRV